MKISDAVILGFVEGLTEFLPVSSTGHLILTAHLLGIPHDSFTKSFEIAIQLGSILAVVFLYWERLLKDVQTWKRILVAFIPTGLLGISFYKLIKGYLIGNDVVVVGALVLGGAFLIFADRLCQRWCFIGDIRHLSLKRAFFVGLFQSLAMVPGVSRSASTILGGMFMGLRREKAAEFSFLLAVPTMFVATSYDLYKSYDEFSLQQWHILAVGFITAFLTALVTVRIFLSYVSRHSFLSFGIYRMVVGLAYAYFIL